MDQINSLTSQVLIVSSSLKATFDAIDKNHKIWDKKEKGEKVSPSFYAELNIIPPRGF